MFLRSCFFLSFVFFSSLAFADQLIIEPDMGRQPILNAIHDTQHTLDLVMYGFTDTEILDALIQKKNEGKSTKVILEASPYRAEQENNRTIKVFNQQDIHWQGELPAIKLIHQKTLLIDNKKAVVMTFNFTHSTFSKERNFALVIDDPERVKAISAIFDADWNHVPISNTCADIILSPDDSREKLLSLLEHAKHSIQIYAQSVNDYKMLGALANAARRSVEVSLLTTQALREKPAHYLQRAGVQVAYSKKLMIHAKVFIVDEQKAVIGSVNMTKPSLDDNRELAVVTTDKSVITDLKKVFQQDWDNAL